MPSSSFSMFTDEGNGHEASSKDLRFPSVSLYKEPKDLEVPHNLCPERTRPSFCEHDDECFASASIEARKMNRRDGQFGRRKQPKTKERIRAGATIEGRRRMRPPAEGISPGP